MRRRGVILTRRAKRRREASRTSAQSSSSPETNGPAAQWRDVRSQDGQSRPRRVMERQVAQILMNERRENSSTLRQERSKLETVSAGYVRSRLTVAANRDAERRRSGRSLRSLQPRRTVEG